MSAARSGHLAVLLPHNNSVLLVGGSAAVSAVELYQSWTGSFVSTGSMSAARAQAAASATGTDGMLLVAGGSDGAASLNSGEVYGFATVKTDKDDYAPGEIVTITGGGWEADDSVMFTLTEVNNPDPHPPRVWFLTADAVGNVFDNSFYPEAHDDGIRFMLTAVGERSQAMMTFTDHAPHGTRTFNFATSGLGVATSITITGSRNIPVVAHTFTAYSVTFTSPGPGPLGGVGAAITITSGINAFASTLTYAGFPTSVPGVGGTYNLVSTSPTSPISVPTTAGTTTVPATYTYVPSDSTPPVGSGPLAPARVETTRARRLAG